MASRQKQTTKNDKIFATIQKSISILLFLVNFRLYSNNNRKMFEKLLLINMS